MCDFIRHYIVICAKAVSHDKLNKWAGLVESKIRILIGQLESSEGIELAHIYPRSYGPPPNGESVSAGENYESLKWFVGLEFQKSDGKSVKVTLTSEIQTFSTAGRLGVETFSIHSFFHRYLFIYFYLFFFFSYFLSFIFLSLSIYLFIYLLFYLYTFFAICCLLVSTLYNTTVIKEDKNLLVQITD